MAIILFDTSERNFLFPFTYTRPVADIRTGLLTAAERWERLTGEKVFSHTAAYLQNGRELPSGDDHIYINAAVVVDRDLVSFIMNLAVDVALIENNEIIAARFNAPGILKTEEISPAKFKKHITYHQPVKKITRPWHIFQFGDETIRHDIALVTAGRKSQPVSGTNGLTSPENIFLEDGAQLEHCIINASAGPVYIGRGAIIMEGCMIRGPFAAGEGSVLKMGTKIYGATATGPYCTAGGEIKNTIMMGYSNKAHDGYLGDSVIGEWCNLGAGTSGSNVRNDASDVYVDMGNKKFTAGLKCGLLMGDYSRCAINTSFNTGTFAGIASSIFGTGLTPKYIPNFTWGYTDRYFFEKAIEHIDNWKKLKKQRLTDTDIQILEHLYKQTV